MKRTVACTRTSCDDAQEVLQEACGGLLRFVSSLISSLEHRQARLDLRRITTEFDAVVRPARLTYALPRIAASGMGCGTIEFE